MSDLPPVAQRHLDLWEQRESRLSQLVVGLLPFALLAQWKVAAPLAADAREHAAIQAQLVQGRGELELEAARLSAIEPLQAALAQVGETIGREPWRDQTQRLI